MACRNLQILAAALTASLAGEASYAQSPVPSAAVAVDLCPMPVFGLSVRDTMPVFMPDPGVQYFIRMVPAGCRNPLEPGSIERNHAVNRRIERHNPFTLTPEQAEAFRRRLIERADSARAAPNRGLPRRRE